MVSAGSQLSTAQEVLQVFTSLLDSVVSLLRVERSHPSALMVVNLNRDGNLQLGKQQFRNIAPSFTNQEVFCRGALLSFWS